MPAAPLIMDEPFRLEALHRLGVLDTPAERRFDRVVLIARALTRASTAVMSLVDADRQWFKAKLGLEVSETPRDVAFCSHAILGDDVTWVEDARVDERFADNPLVLGEPRIRFYAGAPIRLPGDVRIGTVCVFDPEPRAYDPLLAVGLNALAELAAEQLTTPAA